MNLAWTAGNSNTRFGIAAKYQIDQDASFSVSVDGYVHLKIGSRNGSVQQPLHQQSRVLMVL